MIELRRAGVYEVLIFLWEIYIGKSFFLLFRLNIKETEAKGTFLAKISSLLFTMQFHQCKFLPSEVGSSVYSAAHFDLFQFLEGKPQTSDKLPNTPNLWN